MSRKRLDENETSVVLSVRVPSSVEASLVFRAASRGVTLAELIRDLLMSDPKVPVVSEELVVQVEKKPAVREVPPSPLACTHPKGDVKKFSWGKQCGLCNTIL